MLLGRKRYPNLNARRCDERMSIAVLAMTDPPPLYVKRLKRLHDEHLCFIPRQLVGAADNDGARVWTRSAPESDDGGEGDG